MPSPPAIALLVAALLPAGHAAAGPGRPDNFIEWRAGLHSAAQPSAQWLSQLKEKGYDVVINLAPPQSHGSMRDEGGIVHEKAPVAETAIKLNAVWAPDRAWRNFIEKTLQAHGRPDEVF